MQRQTISNPPTIVADGRTFGTIEEAIADRERRAREAELAKSGEAATIARINDIWNR